LHAQLHAGDELGVLRVNPPVDPPVQVPRSLHFAPLIWKRIADLADHRLGRAHRHELHEVDLVRIDVERDVGEQLVIEPLALVALGQMLHARKEALVGALRRNRGLLLDQLAFHPVDVILRFDPVVAAEQARQARVADGDMQMVGIIVGDRLPVERPWTQSDAPDRAQVPEAVWRNFVFVGRHHLRD